MTILAGIRIIDLSSVIFGPYATQMMADMGAEVIKVEPPEGDLFRRAGKPARTKGMGAHHMTLNRGKKSVALDLKQRADADRLRALIPTADIFIHNIRTDAVKRLGFGYDAVRAIRPDIIYVHCTGFGSDGPYAPLQAYDDVIQAATGAVSLAARRDPGTPPRYDPSATADKVAGLHGTQAMLAALVHRLRTGEGQFVEVPMFELFTAFVYGEHIAEAVFVPPTGPIGYQRQLDPHRQPYPTADGHVSIVPYTDQNIVDLFAILGAPELLAARGWDTPLARFRAMSDIHAEIARLTPARTTADWLTRFRAARVPAMPVTPIDAIFDDPHLKAVGMFREVEHPSEGRYRQIRPPIRYSAMPDPDIGHAPQIGEHQDLLD